MRLLAIFAFAFAALIAALTAHASAPTLAERIATLVPQYGSRKVELVDAREFGEAVATACKGERECAARLTAMAILESGLSLNVSKSIYEPHQGDAYVTKEGVRVHRAAGTWQLHKSRINADTWGSESLLVQARDARRMQLGALAECRSFRVDQAVAFWRVLAGRGCMGAWRGEVARAELVTKLMRKL